MEIKHNEAITAAGLRVSMPIPGVVRVTDGKHKSSFAVSAKARKSAPNVADGRLTWGRIAVEPENGMALYYDGILLCADYGETMDYLNGRIRRIQIAVCGHRVAQKVIADGYPGPDSLSVHWMA